MNRHAPIAVAPWMLITIAGRAAVLAYDPFPLASAEQATLIDDAFTLLAVPVFALVVAFPLYSDARRSSTSRRLAHLGRCSSPSRAFTRSTW